MLRAGAFETSQLPSLASNMGFPKSHPESTLRQKNTLPIYVNDIGNPFLSLISRKPREQNCQRDSGVDPTTLMLCPNTVSARTLNALLQSLHGVMPDRQGGKQ